METSSLPSEGVTTKSRGDEAERDDKDAASSSAGWTTTPMSRSRAAGHRARRKARDFEW